MADDDTEVEVITSPRKVANLRRLSVIRRNARWRLSAVPTAPPQPTLRRVAGQKQAMLAFAKKPKAPATLSKLKIRPFAKDISAPAKPAPALPSMSSSDDAEETVDLVWE